MHQFTIQGYSKSYRCNRKRNGDGIFTYVREDIPSREFKIHNTSEDIESIFMESNLVKTEWLFCGCYHPSSQSDQSFFENIGKLRDKYSKLNDKFMFADGFDVEIRTTSITFLYECNAKNIVKENTCFKNPLIPSCVDLFIINSPLNFQNTIGFLNGLSYFHKMVIRVLKMSFKKHSSIERHDRNYKYFDQTKFKNNPNKKMSGGISNYESFKPNFTEVINKHASLRNSLEVVMLYTLLKT